MGAPCFRLPEQPQNAHALHAQTLRLVMLAGQLRITAQRPPATEASTLHLTVPLRRRPPSRSPSPPRPPPPSSVDSPHLELFRASRNNTSCTAALSAQPPPPLRTFPARSALIIAQRCGDVHAPARLSTSQGFPAHSVWRFFPDQPGRVLLRMPHHIHLADWRYVSWFQLRRPQRGVRQILCDGTPPHRRNAAPTPRPPRPPPAPRTAHAPPTSPARGLVAAGHAPAAKQRVRDIHLLRFGRSHWRGLHLVSSPQYRVAIGRRQLSPHSHSAASVSPPAPARHFAAGRGSPSRRCL